MIEVHKTNGHKIVINAELIENLESGHETVICLATGNRYVVRESTDEITEKILEYKRKIHSSNGTQNPIKGYIRE